MPDAVQLRHPDGREWKTSDQIEIVNLRARGWVITDSASPAAVPVVAETPDEAPEPAPEAALAKFTRK